MTDWMLSAVPTYGPWLVAIVTFMSCLAMPVPASMLMLAAGGFAASGDLSVWQVALAALLGALCGDQIGYWIARKGGAHLLDRFATGKRAQLLARARAFVAAKGAIAVFLSRWLVSPLGPYANAIAGATRMRWLPFATAAFAGELVWVGVYVGAGYAFGDNLEAATEFAGSILGFLAAGAVAAGLGWWLWTLAKRER
ncbi:MAG: DedA family protein [Pseudotabrizicola sp.]|uniref:DedA family protein n=1 Tax=Pseudotabrizicola sp. TaxID=2939647 RepID=UPI002715DCF8|nr:DedA family protein [Pseudotabrizicola sp.]MDO8883821.1 DedA family protein [Pseudotabrizicola sp.]MDP2079758.1 DedA family protein [Pseudotabrizicola sp.]MDZ7574759.1 DedA family protein [Pseudotabrizicola sp.]